MKKMMFVIVTAAIPVLCSCSYLPSSDPNYRDATYHDFTIGKNYEPYEWKRNNTATFLQGIWDLITGKRKMTW